MFKHLFINKIKVLLKNKSMLFWSMIFPFVLGTFFYLAFGNLNESFEFETIDIAVINNNEYTSNTSFKTLIDNLSKEGDSQVFNTVYVGKEKADTLLLDGEIEGYILMKNNKPEMVIKENGIEETIIKSVLDEYYQLSSVMVNLINYDPNVIYSRVLENLYKEHNYVVDDSNEKIDFSVHYFYTLIAMTCLYGSFIGLEVIKDSEANLSKKGARISVAPVNKFKIILSGLSAGYLIQVVAIALLFLYLIFVLGIDFGSKVMPTVILALVGCLAGTSLGVFIGVSNRKNEGFKVGLLISVIMACCFFAGMMGAPGFKMFFDEKFPIFSKVNPINMITDGLYSLFAYDNLDVYYNALIRISVFSSLLIILSFVFIRRKKYDSI